jgi:hypothetical protein
MWGWGVILEKTNKFSLISLYEGGYMGIYLRKLMWVGGDIGENE